MKKILKKTFVPHKIDNPRPIFWHPVSIIFLVLVLLFLSDLVAQNKFDSIKNKLLGDIRTGVLISLTNKERVKNDISILTENELLTKAAQLKAEDMVKKGYFAHYSPDGVSPWFWIEEVGYDYQKAGENLAVNFESSKEVIDAWMNSPTHRENIVKEGYTEIGIATASGTYKGKEGIFVVQIFGTPKRMSMDQFAFSIENKNVIDKESSVQGISITKINFFTITDLITKSEFRIIIFLIMLSIFSIIGLFISIIKWRHISKKSYLAIFVLLITLSVSVVSIFNFFQEISIQII